MYMTRLQARRARLLTQLSEAREREAFLYSVPITASGERTKVRLCRQAARLENQIADIEFQLRLAVC
jgi:hypothetical protein